MQYFPDDAIVVDCYQPHLSWVKRVFNQIYRFKSQMVVELVLHEACMLAYVSEDCSFSDPGREAWIAVPFSVAKLAQTTAISDGLSESLAPWQLLESS